MEKREMGEVLDTINIPNTLGNEKSNLSAGNNCHIISLQQW